MKCRQLLSSVIVLSLTLSAWVWAEPKLVRTDPADGASGVPTDIGVIRFYFDQPMNQEQWTFWQSDKGQFPPQKVPNDDPWRDPQCCELAIGPLEPNTTYAIQLNSARRKGFAAARDGAALPITTISFTTGAGQGGAVPPVVGRRNPLDAGPAPGGDAPAKRNPLDVPPTDGPRPPMPPDSPAGNDRIVGTWVYRDQAMEFRVEMRRDGTFDQEMKSEGQTERNRGRYRLQGNQLRIEPENEEPETLTVEFMPDGSLQVTEAGSNESLRLTRAAGGGDVIIGRAGPAPVPDTRQDRPITPPVARIDPEYGLHKDKPIKVCPPGQDPVSVGIKAEYWFLKALRDSQGRPFKYERMGNVGQNAEGHIIDKWKLEDADGKEIIIYLDAYGEVKDGYPVPPLGMTLDVGK